MLGCRAGASRRPIGATALNASASAAEAFQDMHPLPAQPESAKSSKALLAQPRRCLAYPRSCCPISTPVCVNANGDIVHSLKHHELLRTLAKHRNFGRAAQALGVPQPSL